MRVVFLGNCADYSPRFLEALVERTRTPAAATTLVAVICPQRFASPRAALAFAAKRRVGRALGRLPLRWHLRVRARTGPWTRIQQLASDAGAPVLWPRSLGEAAVLERVKSLKPDVAIVAGLDQILREPVLAAFPPVFNLHPSLLPEHRGGLPEFWQLDAGLREGGVTVHQIERGVDTGPIVMQRRFPIEPWLDADGLLARSAQVGAELMNAFLDGYPHNVATAVPQQGGSYQPFPTPQDRVVPFARPAGAVFNRARAVGWGSPLVLHVPREAWEASRATMAEQAQDGAHPTTTVTLHLYDPVPFESYTEGSPGLIARTPDGGVVVTCNPGTVLFRRAKVA